MEATSDKNQPVYASRKWQESNSFMETSTQLTRINYFQWSLVSWQELTSFMQASGDMNQPVLWKPHVYPSDRNQLVLC